MRKLFAYVHDTHYIRAIPQKWCSSSTSGLPLTVESARVAISAMVAPPTNTSRPPESDRAMGSRLTQAGRFVRDVASCSPESIVDG